jgi:hypothetical protein
MTETRNTRQPWPACGRGGGVGGPAPAGVTGRRTSRLLNDVANHRRAGICDGLKVAQPGWRITSRMVQNR